MKLAGAGVPHHQLSGHQLRRRPLRRARRPAAWARLHRGGRPRRRRRPVRERLGELPRRADRAGHLGDAARRRRAGPARTSNEDPGAAAAARDRRRPFRRRRAVPGSAPGHRRRTVPARRLGHPARPYRGAAAPETLLANLDALVHSVDPGDLTVSSTSSAPRSRATRPPCGAHRRRRRPAYTANANLPQTVALLRDGQTVLAPRSTPPDAIRRWAAGLAQLARRCAGPTRTCAGCWPTAHPPPASSSPCSTASSRRSGCCWATSSRSTASPRGGCPASSRSSSSIRWWSPAASPSPPATAPPTSAWSSTSTTRRPACTATTTRCSAADQAKGSSVRGTNNAPRPGGRDPAAGAGGASPDNSALAGYDPATGLVLGPDGNPLQFGGTGGQYQLAGDQSWKQLLLAGVTP